MGAASEYELISRAVEFTLQHAQQAEDQIVERLQVEAGTPLVNALRTLTMQSAIVAVGCFSVFEALLQQKKGWANPFEALDRQLRSDNETDLAGRFRDYRDAINVLKHGAGRSYERLLARKATLPFIVKDRGERFFDEGDVSEGIRLIKADHAFVRQCAEIIQQVVHALRSDPVC